MIKSESIKNIAGALVKLQSEIGKAKKDKNNPFFNSKYADLESIHEVCKESLKSNGLAITQTVDGFENNIIVNTILIHAESGEWIESSIPVIFGQKKKDGSIQKDMQALGSAITYARRYGIAGILNIVQEDDDGNSASRPQQNEQNEQKEEKKKKVTFSEAKTKIEKINSSKSLEVACDWVETERAIFNANEYAELQASLSMKNTELNII